MKDCIISIKNDTDFTPEVTAVHLNGCHWLDHQSIVPPAPIANHGTIAGWVEGEPTYEIRLTVRCYFYSENVSATIRVFSDHVEIRSDHSDHLLFGGTWVEREGVFMVFLELETFAKRITDHAEAFQLAGGGEDFLVVRAGTVSSFIKKVDQEGGRAHQVSVNRSLVAESRITDALLRELTQSPVFQGVPKIAVGWQKKIEQKGGMIRKDALHDNMYHCLLDNLESEYIGGLFQELSNPNYLEVAPAYEKAKK